jgi:hypothetical protein
MWGKEGWWQPERKWKKTCFCLAVSTVFKTHYNSQEMKNPPTTNDFKDGWCEGDMIELTRKLKWQFLPRDLARSCREGNSLLPNWYKLWCHTDYTFPSPNALASGWDSVTMRGCAGVCASFFSLQVCWIALTYNRQMAPASHREGRAVTCWMVLAQNISTVIFPTCHISRICGEGKQNFAAWGV